MKDGTTYRDVAAAEQPPSRDAQEGRAYVAVIGIDRYRAWNRLYNAVNDAEGALKMFAGLGFELVAPPLLDDSATGDALRRLVVDDLSGLGRDDSLVVFFAGHGYTVTRTYDGTSVRDGYLIPVDGDRPGGRAGTWIRLESWLTEITRIPAKHILVILDACHSGLALGPSIRWRSRGRKHARREPLEQLRRRRSRRVITSALDDQVATDGGPVPGHSLFTGCLIEAMTGGLVASTGHHVVTGSEIAHYVQRRVSAYPGSAQTPDFGALELDDRGDLLVRIRSDDAVERQTTAGDATAAGAASRPPSADELPLSKTSHRRFLLMGGAAVMMVAGAMVVAQIALQARQSQAGRDTELRYAATQQENGRKYALEGRSLPALPYLVEAARRVEAGPALRMLVHATRRGLPLVPGLDHNDKVTRAAFSPDGTRIVTACADGTAYVWDAATGSAIAALASEQDRAHATVVVSAAFSPDGKWIVTASEDRTAAIWNADTGSRRGKLLQHDGTVESAMFSSDGRYIVTASLDHSARIWSAATGDLVSRLDHADAVMTAMFNRDGTRVVTASADGTAGIWNARTRAREHKLEHKGPVLSAAFSPDGTRVVTASQDGTAQIWDTETGKPRAMKGLATGKALPLALTDRDGVTGASFDASGAYVVTTSDNGARVWDATTGAPVTPWLEHGDRLNGARLNGAVFAPSGGRLLTASTDGTARIWDTATGRMLLPVLEHTESVASAVFSADGTRVVTASADHTAQIWDASRRVPTVKLELSGFVRQAGFSPDGKRLVTTSDDATVGIWNTVTGAQDRMLPHRGRVLGAAFSVDGKRIVTTSADQVARIWDADGRMIAAIQLPELAGSATLCPEDRRLITRGGDASQAQGTLRLWDPLTGASVPRSSADSDEIVSAAVNQDCTRLVALSQDRTARIWDPVSGAVVAGMIRLPGAAAIIAISPDGDQIVTASPDSIAQVWEVSNGRAVARALEDDQPVVSAAFSPDGARILAIRGDRTAQVWDARTGKPLTPLLYTDDLLVTATFSTDGNQLFAADRHAVRTWDVALEPGGPSDWAELARKNPYVLDAVGVSHRAPAPRAGAYDRHGYPSLSP